MPAAISCRDVLRYPVGMCWRPIEGGWRRCSNIHSVGAPLRRGGLVAHLELTTQEQSGCGDDCSNVGGRELLLLVACEMRCDAWTYVGMRTRAQSGRNRPSSSAKVKELHACGGRRGGLACRLVDKVAKTLLGLVGHHERRDRHCRPRRAAHAAAGLARYQSEPESDDSDSEHVFFVTPDDRGVFLK